MIHDNNITSRKLFQDKPYPWSYDSKPMRLPGMPAEMSGGRGSEKLDMWPVICKFVL